MKVPLLDLTAQYASLKAELAPAIEEVLASQHFILGPVVTRFEQEMAACTGAKHAVGCASGSDALLLALMALDVRAGDRVLTTPFTFFATAGAIARLGAVPVFVDIDPATFNMRIDQVDEALRSRGPFKALMPVHLYGQCVPMAPLLESAKRHGVPVIEDAAQAIGARRGDRMAGTMGAIGCFSFFPSKNLGAWGDGGLLTTNDDALADRLRILRVHGSPKRYYHREVGVNSRLDALQAAVLSVKLRHLHDWIAKRQAAADRYRALLEAAGLSDRVRPPAVAPGGTHTYHQFVVRVSDRDALREHCAQAGIGTEVYYPLPLHLQECFRSLGCKAGDFPESERASAEVLALPMFPEITEPQQQAVVEAIAAFYRRSAPAGGGRR